jgi:hypothetical protein
MSSRTYDKALEAAKDFYWKQLNKMEKKGVNLLNANVMGGPVYWKGSPTTGEDVGFGGGGRQIWGLGWPWKGVDWLKANVNDVWYNSDFGEITDSERIAESWASYQDEETGEWHYDERAASDIYHLEAKDILNKLMYPDVWGGRR